MPTSQAGCGPAGLATNRKSLLMLLFPNDAEEFSSFPLSFWFVCLFLFGPTLPLESFFFFHHTLPVPVAPIGSVWKYCNPHLTTIGDLPGIGSLIWGMLCLFLQPLFQRWSCTPSSFYTAKDHLVAETRGCCCVTLLLAFSTNKALFSAHARLFFQLLSIPAAAVAFRRVARFFFLSVYSKQTHFCCNSRQEVSLPGSSGRSNLFGFLIIV